MNIAIAQMQTMPGAFDQTCARMLEFAQRAKDEGARLAIFGAHTLAGGCPIDEADQEGFMADLIACIQEFAGQTPLDCLVPVVGEMGGAQLFEAVLIRNHEIHPLRMEDEFESFRQELFGEGGQPQEPHEFATFELDGLRFAVAFSNEELDAIGDRGHAFDAVIFAPVFGFSHDNPSTQLASALTESRYQGEAEHMGAWLIVAGSLGVIDTQVFPGASFVLAPWGELAAEAPSFEEVLLGCTIDPYSEGPLAQPLTPDVPDRLLSLMSALIFGLNGFCQAEGVRDVAVVMDGSLASSMVATLACDALGPIHVHALVGGAATPELDAAARDLASRLHVDATYAPEGSDIDHVEALRAQLVRSSGALALLNLDKTGYCLDNRAGVLSVGGLAPLGDVYRSDVVALARLRNTISPVIGAASMRAWAPPRIEGIAKRYLTAESQLEFIDYVLSGKLEWGRTYTQIVEEDRGGELAEHILEIMRIRRMARLAAPRVIIVSSQSLMESPQAFGMRWHDRVRSKDDQDWQQISEFLQSMSGPQARPNAARIQQEFKDTMSFLRDLALSGGLFDSQGFTFEQGGDASRGSHSGSEGETWSFGNPFSEN